MVAARLAKDDIMSAWDFMRACSMAARASALRPSCCGCDSGGWELWVLRVTVDALLLAFR